MASFTVVQNNDPVTVLAGEAIAEGQLLTLAGFTASVCVLAAEADAVATEAIASGAYGPARLLAYGETYKVIADANGHAAGATLYNAAAGLASDTQGVGAYRIGEAIDAGVADELCEFRFKPGFTIGT